MNIKVTPRVVHRDVSRTWAKAYIRCKNASDDKGYIYCRDCSNFGRFKFCHRVADLQVDQPYPTSLEMCLSYVPREAK